MNKLKITISMLEALKTAAHHPDGLCGGDGGVRSALVRRGLATFLEWPKIGAVITASGRDLIATQYDHLKATLPETRQGYPARWWPPLNKN